MNNNKLKIDMKSYMNIRNSFKKKSRLDKNRYTIAQRIVENPLTINDRIFKMRVYILIVYLFKEPSLNIICIYLRRSMLLVQIQVCNILQFPKLF